MSISLHLIFLNQFLTKPRAHHFHYASLSVNPGEPLVSVPFSPGVTDVHHSTQHFMCVLGIQIQFASLKVVMAMADLSVSVVVMFGYGGSHSSCWATLMVVEAVDMG